MNAVCGFAFFRRLTLYPLASGASPVSFQTQSAASLKPTASSHIVLLWQSNGSYTGYEMAEATPYDSSEGFPRQYKALHFDARL